MIIPPKKRVATFIKQVRDENGWSQKQLADKLKVSQPRIVEWEASVKVPSSEVLFKIADLVGKEVVLGQRPDYLT